MLETRNDLMIYLKNGVEMLMLYILLIMRPEQVQKVKSGEISQEDLLAELQKRMGN